MKEGIRLIDEILHKVWDHIFRYRLSSEARTISRQTLHDLGFFVYCRLSYTPDE